MGPDLRSVLLLDAWFLVIWIVSTFNRITVTHLSRIASPQMLGHASHAGRDRLLRLLVDFDFDFGFNLNSTLCFQCFDRDL